MAKPDIWMPLYIGDYLADTMHLTTEQHGAYLLLIMAYWKNGGALSSNDSRLAATCRLSADAWSMHKHTLASFFDLDSDPALWIHVRAEREMAKAGNNQEKRTLRAKKAAESRWAKGAPSNAPGNAPSIQQAMLNECPSPSPSPLIDQKLKSPPTPKPKKPKPEFDETWFERFWKLYPNKTAKPKALEAFRRKCSSEDDFEKIMAGLRQHVLSELFVKDSGRFQPHPTTWLNQDRYNDEVKPYVAGSNTGTSGQSRPSLVDRVRNANAHLFDDEPPAWEPESGAFDAEFERIHEADGSLMGSDD